MTDEKVTGLHFQVHRLCGGDISIAHNGEDAFAVCRKCDHSWPLFFDENHLSSGRYPNWCDGNPMYEWGQ